MVDDIRYIEEVNDIRHLFLHGTLSFPGYTQPASGGEPGNDDVITQALQCAFEHHQSRCPLRLVGEKQYPHLIHPIVFFVYDVQTEDEWIKEKIRLLRLDVTETLFLYFIFA